MLRATTGELLSFDSLRSSDRRGSPHNVRGAVLGSKTGARRNFTCGMSTTLAEARAEGVCGCDAFIASKMGAHVDALEGAKAQGMAAG